MRRVIYDIDNTITLNSKGVSYDKKKPNPFLSKEDLSSLAAEEICYYTARNMLSLGEDLTEIRGKMLPVLQHWLEDNCLPTGPIYIGKPYCGEQGIYVDDRAVNLNGHKLSLTSGLIKTKICVIVSLFNAMGSVHDIVLELIELSTLCPELKVILVNNGSKDETGEFVSAIADAYPFIQAVNLSENVGYGGAIKEGMLIMRGLCPNNDYSLIVSHGNSKFSILDFVKGICKTKSLAQVCFTRRLNRPLGEQFLTKGLLSLYRMFARLNCRDCIGASRYIPSSILRSLNFDLAPDDYLFDMWLALALRKKNFKMVPVVQMAHIEHKSSWGRARFARLKMIVQYLAYLWNGMKSWK